MVDFKFADLFNLAVVDDKYTNGIIKNVCVFKNARSKMGL